MAYLTTAAKREAVRRSGARDRDRPITAAMANEMLAVDPEFDEEFACAERSITVQRMVERLPGRCREAMTLKLEGLTRREAADRMGISLKAYENQVSHNVSYSAVSQACWDRMFARQFCQRSGDMNQHR